MANKNLIGVASACVCCAVMGLGLGRSRAGIMSDGGNHSSALSNSVHELNRAPTRNAQMQAPVTLPEDGSPPQLAPEPSGAEKPPAQSPPEAADAAVLDRTLMKGWAGAFYGNYRPRLLRASIPAHYVALTFDDGPKGAVTAEMLDDLQRYGAHATFFVVGRMCQKYPELVSRIVSDGDELGNHTFNHFRLPTISLASVADELERTRRLVHQLTGQTLFLFRPPGGRTNAQVQTVVDSLGYTTVFWRLDSSELQPNMDANKVYHRVADNVRDGDIVLMHNGDPNILAALPRILENLSQRGYQFVTVSELMQLNGAQPIEESTAPEADTE